MNDCIFNLVGFSPRAFAPSSSSRIALSLRPNGARSRRYQSSMNVEPTTPSIR